MQNWVTIENVVASVSFNQPIDLYQLSSSVGVWSYDPKRFPAVIIKFARPRVTALVFSSGKVVLVGAKGEEEVKLAYRRLVFAMTKAHVVQKGQPKLVIHNVVASISFSQRIRLEELGKKFEKTVYEPEQFPGLIMRDEDVVFVVFSSGKVICAGARSEKHVLEAAQRLYGMLVSSGGFERILLGYDGRMPHRSCCRHGLSSVGLSSSSA